MKIEFDTEDLCHEDALIILGIINELYPLTVLDADGIETPVKEIEFLSPESTTSGSIAFSPRFGMSIEEEFLA